MSVTQIRDYLRLTLAGRGLREVARPPAFRIPWRYPYRGREAMLRALGPELAAMTTWTAADSEPRGEKLGPRSPTLLRHLPVRESVVDRARPIRMLVIGGFYGGALPAWQEYLHADSLIVGLDVDSKLLRVANSEGSYVRVGAEQEVCSLKDVAAEFGPFDVIVDGGRHTSSHMVDSFRCLFANALIDGGVYIVEDVDCDYSTFYRDSPVSFMELIRALIDAMHSHYQVATGETGFRAGPPARAQEASVPVITAILGSVEIHDSVVVVRRALRNPKPSAYRA